MHNESAHLTFTDIRDNIEQNATMGSSRGQTNLRGIHTPTLFHRNVLYDRKKSPRCTHFWTNSYKCKLCLFNVVGWFIYHIKLDNDGNCPSADNTRRI